MARRLPERARLALPAGQRARDAILEPLLQRLLPFLELATNVAERVADAMEKIPLDKLFEVLAPTLSKLSRDIDQLNKLLGKRFDDKLDPILFFDQIPWPSETDPIGAGGTSVAPGFFDSPWRDATGARVDGPRFGANLLEDLP